MGIERHPFIDEIDEQSVWAILRDKSLDQIRQIVMEELDRHSKLEAVISAAIALRNKREFDCIIVESNDWCQLQDKIKDLQPQPPQSQSSQDPQPGSS